MKKQVLFAILGMLVSLSAFSQVFTAKTAEGVDMWFKVTDSTAKTVQVGTEKYNPGRYENAISTSYNGKLTIPSKVYYENEEYNVTAISMYAFNGCWGMTSIVIPNSVTTIGDYAFEDCSSLTTIEIPNSVIYIGRWAINGTHWYQNQPNGIVYAGNVACGYKGNMPSNTSLKLREGTVSISPFAFSDCQELNSIEIPDGLISIGRYAFYYCTKLSSLNIPQSVTSIGERAFDNTPWYNSLVDDMIYINNVAYKYRGAGTSVQIKEGTVSISGEAFSSCSNLASIEIPNSVVSIGDYAFYKCRALTNIAIPSSVTNIGVCAFQFSAINSIEILNSVTTIGKYAFRETALTSVTLPNGLTNIEDGTFWWCSKLTSIEIPNSVKRIEDEAFLGCIGLEKIEIPNGVLSLGDKAFGSCKILSSIEIPNSITNIGKQCFQNCEALNTITLPSGIMNIGEDAFSAHKSTIITIDNLSSWLTFDNSNWKSNPLNTCEESHFYLGGAEITDLDIPSGTQSISSGAFYNGKNIISVSIPQSVTSIGNSAFYGCSGLKSITVHNNRPPSATSAITSQEVYDNCTLYVPEGSENIYYASTFWNAFKTIKTIDAIEKVPQDVNGDGIVDTQDVLEIYKQEH